MSAAKIIKRAQADGVNIALSPVGTLKISGDPANVSRWVAVVKSHKSEIVDTLTCLELARSDFLTHKDTCPICRLSWAATASCETFGELWLAYHDAMVAVHGADLVDGPPDRAGQPESLTATENTNGYRIVVTAQVRPPAWKRARDTYHAHLMDCPICKPSGLCQEGRQLKHEYDVITAVPALGK